MPILLEALTRQQVDFPWEVVVVVDGSTDQTAELIDSYRDRLPLRQVRHSEPRGTAVALTDGFNAAQGTYLIRCDDDLTPSPTFVADHVAAHAGQSNRAVIGLTRDVFAPTPYALAYGQPANDRARTAAYARPESDRWMHWAANNSLHREAWARSGGFDPQFVYGEDFELGYRLHAGGLGMIIVPGLEVDHRGPANSAATRVSRAYVSGASHRLFGQVHPQATPAVSPPVSGRAQIWRAATRAVAAGLRSPRDARRIGSMIDAALRILPPRWGGRLVALGVEAAGTAGRTRGRQDLASYRSQKRVELADETSSD